LFSKDKYEPRGSYFKNNPSALGPERWGYFEIGGWCKMAINPILPMKTNDDSSLTDHFDPIQAAGNLLAEAISRVLVWVVDAPTMKDRGLRMTVVLFCVRPDLINGATLQEIGETAGRTKQHVHKLAEEFRITTGLKS
jgi:hypothetical protein